MNIENPSDNPTEVKDGPENETDQEANNPQPVEGRESDPNGGGEGEEAGGTGGENEGPDAGQEESAKPQPGLDAVIERFETRLKEEIAPLKEAHAAPKALTEEQWIEHEKKYGVPRQTIQAFTQQNVRLAERLRSEFREMLYQELGDFRTDAALAKLSKEEGFANISSLRAGINEFLKDYSPKDHSNPNLLRKAAIYARGLKSESNVSRARVSDEKNRQVINRIKTGRPDVNTKAKSSKPLSETERQAAELLGDENEYRRLKDPARRIIAA